MKKVNFLIYSFKITCKPPLVLKNINVFCVYCASIVKMWSNRHTELKILFNYITLHSTTKINSSGFPINLSTRKIWLMIFLTLKTVSQINIPSHSSTLKGENSSIRLKTVSKKIVNIKEPCCHPTCSRQIHGWNT
jgi:hypothetical protein